MRHKRGRDRRDFWRAWREERRRLWEESGGPPWEPGHGPPGPPPIEMAHAWREFFHSYMGDWPEHHWAFGGRRFSPWHQGLDSFNPFVASLLSKGGGLLPVYVLHLLARQPRYGNEIMDILTERTGGQWVANPGAIYPLMTMLEAHGLVEGEWEDPHKRTVRIYRLTGDGEQELARIKTIVRPKLREAIAVLEKLVSDLNGDKGEGDEPTGNV
jgi:PadR family transcriptional regulator PadR